MLHPASTGWLSSPTGGGRVFAESDRSGIGGGRFGGWDSADIAATAATVAVDVLHDCDDGVDDDDDDDFSFDDEDDELEDDDEYDVSLLVRPDNVFVMAAVFCANIEFFMRPRPELLDRRSDEDEDELVDDVDDEKASSFDFLSNLQRNADAWK